jgi:hypothetical protein
LSVIVTTTPVIGSVLMSDGVLALTGSGGVGNAPFYLLGSTNLNTPLTSWSRVLTNQFDVNGNFNFTNLITTTNAQGFYLLQIP